MLFTKQFIKTISLALVALLLIPISSVAQQQGQLPLLPIDSAVRTGKLDNGLTYFIRHNTQPEGRAEFYIAQKVGSILEQESQRGLAHFLEHIAFNGTKHFPGKGIINYLETLGVRFGESINAYTGFDQTVYTLMNVPTARTGSVDSCLLILHDWSSFISLEDKEIDDERGVIQEEWRSRDNGNSRAFEKLLSLGLPNNIYAKRLPIGLMDVVRNFKYQELRDYYKKWYRPDLQAIIVVGDVDVDRTEARLKEIFADIPKPINPAERFYVPVERLGHPIAGVSTDPEVTSTTLYVNYKVDVLPQEVKGTIAGLASDIINTLVQQMINERFAEITHKPNAPFLRASTDFGSYLFITKTMNAITFSADAKEGEYDQALKAIAAEIQRLRLYGFTQSELKRALENLKTGYENQYKERTKRKNKSFANEYVDYFTDGGSISGIENEYKLFTEVLYPNIHLDQVNQLVRVVLSTPDVGIFILGPTKDGLSYPTEAELIKKFEAYSLQKVEAPKEEVSNQKLLDKLPKAGKIIKEQKNAQFGTTVWTLSNGARVILKPTTFKEDQILLSGLRPGGVYQFPKSDSLSVKALGDVIHLGGLGKFNAIELGKALTGRSVSLGTGVDDSEISVSGSTRNQDLETMFQLLYLNFTANRADKEAFAAYQQRTISDIEASKANPMSSFSDSINEALYPNYYPVRSLTAEEVKAINYDRALELYNKLFSNARGFQFVFVGNIDAAKFRPLVERYIASLPSKKNADKPLYEKDPWPRKGKYTNHYTKKLTTPMGVVFQMFTGKLPFSLKTNLELTILSNILDQVYMDSLREKEGGTYGAGTSAGVRRHPDGISTLRIVFQTDPAKADRLNKLALSELYEIAEKGVAPEKFDKVVKSLLNDYTQNLKENGFWLGQLLTYFYHGDNFVDSYEQTLKSITREDVRKRLAELLSQKNQVEIILTPEATPAQ